MTDEMALLHQKLDHLTEQVEAQNKRTQMWGEFWSDMTPIANGLTKMAIKELDEVGSDFELEDIMFLLKRLLRDTHLLTEMLNQLESVADMGDEIRRMSRPAFNVLVMQLQQLEEKGYFKFAAGLTDIADRIVTEFDEEDVRALGDNIVTILNTVRNMTQPEVMALANNALDGIEAPVDDISTWQLLRELRDPEVRKGMARLLQVVKGLATQPDAAQN